MLKVKTVNTKKYGREAKSNNAISSWNNFQKIILSQALWDLSYSTLKSLLVNRYHLYMSLFPSVCCSVRTLVCRSIMHYISGTIHYLIIIFGNYVWNDISWHFFHFFEILIFWAARGVKGQKVAQNERQQLHLSHTTSQEQCNILSWFLVHLCEMIISLGVFFLFFLNIDFLGC